MCLVEASENYGFRASPLCGTLSPLTATSEEATMSRRQIMFAVTAPGGVGSEELDKVALLAGALHAELQLFHCIFDPQIDRAGRAGTLRAQEDIHEFLQRRDEQLERIAERLRAGGLPVRTDVRWDYPDHDGIVREVLRRRPTLLVIQSSRRAWASRLVLTQTDYKLIETCPCPVLLIKNAAAYVAPVIVAAVDPARAHDKPASLDDGILAAASMMRDALRGSLQVFHATASWEATVRARPELRDLPRVELEDVQAAYRNAIRERVLALARPHEVSDQHVEVIEGEASELLPRIARGHGAALVVLGAVARSRVGRALIGHTAERVLDELECDVLVVKPPGFRTSVRQESAHHIERSVAHG